MRDRRSMVGLLVTCACDHGNGWASLSVTGSSVTYCYPLGVPAPRVQP